MALDQKLAQLRSKLFQYDAASQAQIAAWEAEARKLMLKTGLVNNDAMKFILAELDRRIADTDFVLANDRKLTTEERNYLFERKDFAVWFRGLFTNAESNLEQIEKAVDQELSE